MTSVVLAATLLVTLQTAPAQRDPRDLACLWGATVRFGPDIRGTLTLLRSEGGWRADIAGFSVPVRVDRQGITFELPDQKASFRGKVNGREIVGQWMGQRTENGGSVYA